MKNDSEIRKVADKVFEARDLAQQAIDLLNSVVAGDVFKTKLDDKVRKAILRARQSIASGHVDLEEGGPCDDLCQFL